VVWCIPTESVVVADGEGRSLPGRVAFEYHVNVWMTTAKTTARFIQPMLRFRRERLPGGPEWLYELKTGWLPGHCREGKRLGAVAVG
jgi:hypothetical protein